MHEFGVEVVHGEGSTHLLLITEELSEGKVNPEHPLGGGILLVVPEVSEDGGAGEEERDSGDDRRGSKLAAPLPAPT